MAAFSLPAWRTWGIRIHIEPRIKSEDSGAGLRCLALAVPWWCIRVGGLRGHVTELRFERTNPGTIANPLFFSWYFARRGPERRGAVNPARIRSSSRPPTHLHDAQDSRELHAKILSRLALSRPFRGPYGIHWCTTAAMVDKPSLFA